jgi:hypothetical protein
MASPVWPLLYRNRSWQLKLQLVSYRYRRVVSCVLVYSDNWRSSLVFNRLQYMSDGSNVCVRMSGGSTVKRCLLVKSRRQHSHMYAWSFDSTSRFISLVWLCIDFTGQYFFSNLIKMDVVYIGKYTVVLVIDMLIPSLCFNKVRSPPSPSWRQKKNNKIVPSA